MPTILAVNGDAAQIAARLLAAAGDQPDRVKVVTGKYIGFSVDDELAAAAGYVLDEDNEVPTEYTEVTSPPTPTAPFVPFAEPVEEPAAPAADEGQADADQPAVENDVPVEVVEPVEEPKTQAPKTTRKSTRTK